MDFKDVFDAHPEVNLIWSVDGMPFLDKVSALNFASGDETKLQPHNRAILEMVDKAKDGIKAKAEAKAEAEADAKAKAEADAKAKAEADAKAKAEADAKAKA